MPRSPSARRSSRPRAWLALAAPLLGLVLAGCSHHPDGTQRGLDQTAVGRNRCLDAKKSQTAPFVVEWDATDLSGFEAMASRDLVFVRYEGCEMQVLSGCNDGSIPGRYGRYQPPQFTSGTDEGFEVRTQNELYARLPLGAASFGGRVANGEGLRLHYHVTGLATASRDAVPQTDLAANPQCKGATHFVQGYHLGAFELNSDSDMSVGVEASSTVASGNAQRTSSEKTLKKGGDLESCKTQSQTACRVPIRLVLRELGQAATGDAPGVTAPPPPPPSAAESPAMKAMQLRITARTKESSGEGAGCLEDLDRADTLDPSGARGPDVIYTRSQCLMRVGKCDEGKSLFREFEKASDKNHTLSDAEIEQRVSIAANKCPSGIGATDDERLTRAMTRVSEASQQKNAAACLEEAKTAEQIGARRPPNATGKSPDRTRSTAFGVLVQATSCLLRAGRCDEAHALYLRAYDLQFKGTMPDAEVTKAAEMTFAPQAKQCKK